MSNKEPGDVLYVVVAGFFWQAILAFRNPPTADKIGFVLGLFFWLLKNRFFCNPLLKLSLRSFLAISEIGFVYSDYEIIDFFCNPLYS